MHSWSSYNENDEYLSNEIRYRDCSYKNNNNIKTLRKTSTGHVSDRNDINLNDE